MTTSILHDKSPFEVLFGDIPAISHLRIFGCACYPLLKPYLTNKLQVKTIKCVFLGYASQYKGYICYDVSGKHTYISRHVVFDEYDFPYAALVPDSKVSISSPEVSGTFSSLPVVTNSNTIELPTPHDTNASDTFISPSNTSDSSSSPPTTSPMLPLPSFPISNSPLSIIGTYTSFSSIPVVPESNAEDMSTYTLPPVDLFNLNPCKFFLRFLI